MIIQKRFLLYIPPHSNKSSILYPLYHILLYFISIFQLPYIYIIFLFSPFFFFSLLPSSRALFSFSLLVSNLEEAAWRSRRRLAAGGGGAEAEARRWRRRSGGRAERRAVVWRAEAERVRHATRWRLACASSLTSLLHALIRIGAGEPDGCGGCGMALGERNSKYTDSFSGIAHAPSLEALMAYLMEPDFLLPCAIFRMEDGIEDLLGCSKGDSASYYLAYLPPVYFRSCSESNNISAWLLPTT